MSKLKNAHLKDVEEIFANVMRRNIVLTKAQKTKIRKLRAPFKQIALKKTSLKKKRKLLQRGGFVGILLSLLAPIVGAAISKAV